MQSTLGSTLKQDKKVLESTLSLDSGTARIEAQMLLQRVLGVSRVHLLAHPEQVMNDAQTADSRVLLQRRLMGEPLAYILGEREFFGLNFKVTPATLIPRPDTELLVELALQRIPQSLLIPIYHESKAEAFRILDLGTGTGAIALSIAHARPEAEITAADASLGALEVAQENVRRLNIGNVRLLHSDWFSALQGEHFNLIASNPPYIAEADPHLVQGDLRFEPHSALASGVDGLYDIRRIVTTAKNHLTAGGWLLLEHGYDQAAQVRHLLEVSGYTDVFSAQDLAGTERVSGGRFNYPSK